MRTSAQNQAKKPRIVIKLRDERCVFGCRWYLNRCRCVWLFELGSELMNVGIVMVYSMGLRRVIDMLDSTLLKAGQKAGQLSFLL
jgi:hypothetical protein